MPHRKNMSRLAVASLIAAAVSAPAAMANPAIDTTASPVQKPTPGNQHVGSEGAMAQSIVPQTKQPANVDLGSEGAMEIYGGPHPSDRARAPQPTALRPGAPTWPEHPRVLVPPAETVATDGGDGGDGIDVEWPVAVLALAGTLLLGGGVGVAGYRLRAQPRPAH